MSFFVSDSLKGRVTEKELEKDERGETQSSSSLIYVRASFDKFSHDFTFVSYKSEKRSRSLTIEIPESYEFISQILNSLVTFEIVTSDGVLDKIKSMRDDFELIRHNERSCYLLKIVISE